MATTVKFCDCGNVATRRLSSKDNKCCERCYQIEAQGYWHFHYTDFDRDERKKSGKQAKSLVALVLFLLMSNLITGCTTPRGFPPVQGIQNFDVVDSKLYRGAQPNAVGLKYIASIGVTRVINLRELNDTWTSEMLECNRLGIRYFQVPLSGTASPGKHAIETVLNCIAESDGPVYVHCQFGCDRTGTVVACYKIRHGDSPETALNDAETHGMSKLSVAMKHFIRNFK